MNCIVFDKTGTLTVGKPVVVNTRLLKNMVLREFYELVAATEVSFFLHKLHKFIISPSYRVNTIHLYQVNSEHPLAKAVVEYAKKFREDEENPLWPEAWDFVSITGHGVKARVRNKEIIVGNKSLILDCNIAIPAEVEDILSEAEGLAQTGILVSIDGEVVGVLAISDPLKPGAKEVISILKSMKVRSVMVTGDNWGTANSVAREVGIEMESVIAEAKPEQKAERVEDLQVHIITCIYLQSVLITVLRLCENFNLQLKFTFQTYNRNRGFLQFNKFQCFFNFLSTGFRLHSSDGRRWNQRLAGASGGKCRNGDWCRYRHSDRGS